MLMTGGIVLDLDLDKGVKTREPGICESKVTRPRDWSVLGLRIGRTNTTAAIASGDGLPEQVTFDSVPTLPTAVTRYCDEWIVGRRALERGAASGIEVAVDFFHNPSEPIVLAGSEFKAEELTRALVGAVKRAAESQSIAPLTHCLLSIPEYFEISQIETLRAAVVSNGLELLATVPDSICGLSAVELRDEEEVVVVVRMGGRFLEVAVIQQEHGLLQVHRIDGDRLGGQDIDHLLVSRFAERPLEGTRKETRSERSRYGLLLEAEAAKRALSTKADAVIAGQIVSRPMMEGLASELAKRTFSVVAAVLRRTEIVVDSVLFHGGSAAIPLFQRAVQDATRKPLWVPPAPDTLSAKGAARRGAEILGRSLREESSDATRVVPYLATNSKALLLGLADGERRCVFPAGTVLPATTRMHLYLRSQVHELRLPLYREDRPIGNLVAALPPLPPHAKVDLEIRLQPDGNVSCDVAVPETGWYQRVALTEGAQARLDENVQFTVYRPNVVDPERWHLLLAFAHLGSRPHDSTEPDPVQEVHRLAEQALGENLGAYGTTRQDSTRALPRKGELTFLPHLEGIEFNPSRATFRWIESVHKTEFRFRASKALNGRVARGTLTVFWGGIVVADIPLSIRIDGTTSSMPATTVEPVTAHRYRNIFASYSRRDIPIVEQVEDFVRTTGDRYLRDLHDIRAGEVWTDRLREMIDDAHVFQLFWSTNSMRSTVVRQEWEYALSLGRRDFLRPVYWEDPFPEAPGEGLPPERLRRLHFQALSGVRASTPASADPGAEMKAEPDGTVQPDTTNLATGVPGEEMRSIPLTRTGHSAAEEQLKRRLLAARERLLGADHPDTLTGLTRLAAQLERMGDHVGAEPLYRRALAAKEHTGQDDCPQFALDLNTYALLLRRLGRFDEAADFLRRAITIEDRFLPPAHPKRPHRRNNLAIVFLMAGQLDDAIRANGDAWELKSHVSEGGHDMTSARVLFTRIVLHWLRGSDAAVSIGHLRTLLEQAELPCHGDINRQWQADDILQHLRDKLTSEQTDFLTSIVAAMNDHTRLPDPDRFPIWRDHPPVALDTPWPQT